MDSMRSLNSSLPRAPPTKAQLDPPETLLGAFKAAALSVTNLYKSAASDQGKARSEGYQDALDELLTFLDKEDIGLSDGEGWRVRRWATERLDGRDSGSHNTESDDDPNDKTERGSSPILQRSQITARPLAPSNVPPHTLSPARSERQVPPLIDTPTIEVATLADVTPPQSTFTFRSSHSYPPEADMILADLENSEQTRPQQQDSTVSSTTSGFTIGRTPRARHHNASRLSTRSSTSSIGRGAGQKRKINLAEFFDIGNLGHKDGGGGSGKRGRFT